MYGFTEVCYILPDQLALATPFWNLLPAHRLPNGKTSCLELPRASVFLPRFGRHLPVTIPVQAPASRAQKDLAPMDMPVPVIPAARFKDHISHTHARCSQHLQIAGSIKILTKRVDPSNLKYGSRP